MRYWCNKKEDDGSIHAIGNGHFIVYGKGPEINQFQGPTYSIPIYGGMIIDEPDREIECRSDRESRSSSWIHTLYEDSENIGSFYDSMDCEFNVFERKFDLEKNIKLKLTPCHHTQTSFYENYDLGKENRDCVMLLIQKGVPYFTGFASLEDVRMYIFGDGVTYIPEDKSIVLNKGKGRLVFVSAAPFEIFKHIAFALADNNIHGRSKAFFEDYLRRGDGVLKLIPEGHPEEKRIRAALESVAVLIKCQQSYDGGILAGHYYPMAYVRDQAGTLRGLIKMGYVEEAKKVLQFWYNKWCVFGNILNADSMGHNNDRLLFTNDEVEVPAYVVYSAFYYLKETGDKDFILSIFPMLKWAFKVQLPHLVKGMTSFSGDETYIAGFTFPKIFVYHGSAESTLLFIESGRRFLKFAEAENLLGSEELETFKDKLKEAQDHYKENFVENGILYGNSPEREKYFKKPRFHRGFCDVDIIKGRPAPLMWLEEGENGYYRCPNCFHEKIEATIDPETRYILGSTGMVPPYYGSELFSKEEIRSNVNSFIKVFKEKGYIPSDINGTRSLGYDFGIFLYNLTYLNDPLKEDALKVMLDVVDGTGSWVEYYDNLKAFNCRCRPWESAINIEALIYYLESR